MIPKKKFFNFLEIDSLNSPGKKKYVKKKKNMLKKNVKKKCKKKNVKKK